MYFWSYIVKHVDFRLDVIIWLIIVKVDINSDLQHV